MTSSKSVGKPDYWDEGLTVLSAVNLGEILDASSYDGEKIVSFAVRTDGTMLVQEECDDDYHVRLTETEVSKLIDWLVAARMTMVNTRITNNLKA